MHRTHDFMVSCLPKRAGNSNVLLLRLGHLYLPMKYKLYHVWSILQLGGDVKPLYFLNALRYDAYLSEYRSKILYLHLESLPQSFIKDGWLAEAYLRNYMSVNALNLIKGEKFLLFLLYFGDFWRNLEFWLFFGNFWRSLPD